MSNFYDDERPPRRPPRVCGSWAPKRREPDSGREDEANEAEPSDEPRFVFDDEPAADDSLPTCVRVPARHPTSGFPSGPTPTCRPARCRRCRTGPSRRRAPCPRSSPTTRPAGRRARRLGHGHRQRSRVFAPRDPTGPRPTSPTSCRASTRSSVRCRTTGPVDEEATFARDLAGEAVAPRAAPHGRGPASGAGARGP